MFGIKDRPFIVRLSSPVYFMGERYDKSPIQQVYEGTMTATINLEDIPKIPMSHNYRLFINFQSQEPTRFAFTAGKNQNEIFTVEFEEGIPIRCLSETIYTDDLRIKMRANVKHHDNKHREYTDEFYLDDHEVCIPDEMNKECWLELDQVYEILKDKPKQKEYYGTIAMAMIAFLEEALKTIELAKPAIV